ncbi:protease IV [Novosphingobium sp. Rr 2-17]|uniref:signal peptide peptidase SppA n=1 Tax=Novosphingobium sp. Rr 2-17 TaxID=555793 RepID=UPI000269854B|nr:signal peptide peptidase SppA [Novosphingobium sp. Rr 2-17]EIZ78579.1 protease IV [Novosphingobium sp. Rr 2-17]
MKFARKVWKLLVGVKDAMALLFLLMFFGLIYAALTARPMAGRVEDGALLLNLDGSIVEEKSESNPLALLSGQAPTREFEARDIERALRLAAGDDRVKAVVIDMSRFLGGRYTHLHDIGEAIDEVRKSGKPVLAFANVYADDATLLAAHASEVWVDPMGSAFVTGPGGNYLFYKGLLDRFKVNAHVYRVGTYKSFVEPYIRTGFSPEAKKDLEGTYGALWDAYRADIAKARPKARLDEMTRDPAAFLKASGGDLAQVAKASGLVDRIGDKTEFDARITKLVGEDTSGSTRGSGKDEIPYAHTSLATWLAANPVKAQGAAIGVITIAGDIVDGDAGPGEAGGDRIARLLDDNIDEGMKALVVRIDSPGGSVMASERIRRAIWRYRERKIPVVVSMANYAASGGYWVSTPGQRVFAEPGTITGSIGVFAVVTSFEKTLADYGVTSDGVRTTPLSGQPDLFGGFTPEVEGLLQGSVENAYRQFLQVVGKARSKTPEQVDGIAQGRVWPGMEAQKIGLVDEIGNLDTALAYAAKVGGVGNGKWHAEYLKDRESSLSAVLNEMLGDTQSDQAAYDFASLISIRQHQQAQQIMARIDALTGTRGMQAYCLECAVEPEAAPRAKASGDWSIMQMLARLTGWK